MPPKVKIEKKEIKPVFNFVESKSWWEFQQYSEEQIQQIDEFFINFQNELKDFVIADFNLSLQNITKQLGIHFHPHFQQQQQNQQQQGLIQIQEQGTYNYQETEKKDLQIKINFLILQNIKIDYATFKILLYLYQQFIDYNVLKFSNNDFNQQGAKLLFDYVCDPTNKKVNKFFFDWNPLTSELRQELFPQLALSNIEFLILRSNQIDDQVTKSLCKAIQESPNCNIQHLELFDNKIGEEGLKAIGELIESYQKFEYLSLAQNNIKSVNNLKKIFSNVGQYILPTQELEEYRQKEKIKEDIIADAKKKKKKINEDELEKLAPLIDVGDGSIYQLSNIKFAYVRNQQMKMLNLAMNPFTEQDKDFVEKFIEGLPEDFQLVLIHSQFEQKTKEKLRNKFKKKVII